MAFRSILIFFTISLCFGCDKVEDSGAVTIQSGILGFWQGILKTTSEGGEGQVTDVALELDTEGAFELTELVGQRQATGVYDDFPQLQSLTLRVLDSEFPELAIAGAIMDYEYQLLDGELLLTSMSHLVRLKRPAENSQLNEASRWLCDQAGLSWQVNFLDQQFLMYYESPEGASIFLKGVFSVEETVSSAIQQGIVMLVQDGQPLIPFTELSGYFTMENGSPIQLDLTPKTSEGDELDTLVCSVTGD